MNYLNPNVTPHSNYTSPFASPRQHQLRPQFQPLLPPSYVNNLAAVSGKKSEDMLDQLSANMAGDTTGLERYSYYLSSLPLYCSDWSYLTDFDTECIALSSYKEGFQNRIHILHGIKYGKEATMWQEDMVSESPTAMNDIGDSIEGFDFHKVSEIEVDYPITNLQWDPSMDKLGNGLNERLAASSEVLRLYKVDHDNYDGNNDFNLTQTHYLTNNTTNGSSTSNHNLKLNDSIMTCPPVTSFDWNKLDNNILITSSVDTTCTVWDLNRSLSTTDHATNKKSNSASVKTQLIAHDSEVFDVKFLHDTTNLFASVGNDGSMRVFDLRSLEHSTIIYEPSSSASASTSANTSTVGGGSYNSKALLKLATSNIDQHYLATIGVNSNQIIIIDTRMPGIPAATLDGSFGGLTNTSINSIKWHPNSNFLLSGGDDCQALIWDCNNLYQLMNKPQGLDQSLTVSSPVLSYEDELEVNNVCWRGGQGDWMGIVSGKGFQAVLI